MKVLAPLVKGPYTSSHIARWCAARQNRDRIHHYAHYAVERAWIDRIDFRFIERQTGICRMR